MLPNELYPLHTVSEKIFSISSIYCDRCFTKETFPGFGVLFPKLCSQVPRGTTVLPQVGIVRGQRGDSGCVWGTTRELTVSAVDHFL